MDIGGTARGGAGAQPELGELARLADELVDEIGAARRHYDEMLATIDGAGVAPDDPASRRAADEAHLVALSMALTGADRDETGAHLRDAFGLDDVEEILDHAFGAGLADAPANGRQRRRFGLRRSRR
jgi:hypothetical protein